MAKNKAEELEAEDAPLTAYAPTALLLQDRDHVIRACDGDQEYIYLATCGRNNFTVVEVYPGLSKPKTHVRDAEALHELVVGKFKTVELALSKLKDMIFEGFEFIPEPQAIVRVLTSRRAEPLVPPAPGSNRRLQPANV